MKTVIAKRQDRRWMQLMAVVVLFLLCLPMLRSAERTYTLNADFDEGVLVNVEHNTVPDQLQLGRASSTLPFIWIPNANNTLSKLDTRTGRELARYYLGPSGQNMQPSRTTVDLEGNCWVANRYAGSVVKVGLVEAGAGIDRNGNGVIDTSQDLNADGTISPNEMLPWGEDECVLFEVIVISGKEGTYVPGSYHGGYTDDWGSAPPGSPGPRSVAIDKLNNCWIGCLGSMKFYYVQGLSGQILRTVDVSPWNHTAYGATIDANGVLWSVNWGKNSLLRLAPDPNNPASIDIRSIGLGHNAYGINVDSLGHVFCSGWDAAFCRVNVVTGTPEWTKGSAGGVVQSRGVAVTADNDVWIASTASSVVQRYDNNGNYKATIRGFNQPSGVAVDADGKVWVCNINDEFIHRIDPASNTIDLSKQVVGSWGHYTYSDMTGVTVRNVTLKTGTWTVVCDSQAADTAWSGLEWNGSTPQGTSIAVRVRSSANQTAWSAWESAVNGSPLSVTPEGRYLQIECTLSGPGGFESPSPILYDLTVVTGCEPPVAGWTSTSNTGSYIKLTAASDCHAEGDLTIFIADPVTSFVAGPYAAGDIVRVTRTTGTPKAVAGKAPVKQYIYLKKGTARIYAIDADGQVGPAVGYPVR